MTTEKSAGIDGLLAMLQHRDGLVRQKGRRLLVEEGGAAGGTYAVALTLTPYVPSRLVGVVTRM